MNFLRTVGRVLQSLPDYGKALVASWWFLVCLVGTLGGLTLPFLPPLKEAVPIWVGLLVALVCWTLAPVWAYHQLLTRLREAQATTTISDVEGLVVNAAGQSRINVTQNITKQYISLTSQTPAPEAVLEVAWEDVALEESAPEDEPGAEGGAPQP